MKARLKHKIIGSLLLLAILSIVLPLCFTQARLTVKQLTLSVALPAPPVVPQAIRQATIPHIVAAQSSTDALKILRHPTHFAPVSNLVLSSKQKTTALTHNAQSSNNSNQGDVRLSQAVSHLGLAKAWVIQLGVFSNQSNVNALSSQLAKQGISSFKKTLSGNKAVVFVGPIATQAELAPLLKVLHQQFNLNGVIKPYQLVGS